MSSYTEHEYTSKRGDPCVDSSIFGKCVILTRAEVDEELKDNECFIPCKSIPESKFDFYLDTEIIKYFACRKHECPLGCNGPCIDVQTKIPCKNYRR